MNRQLAHVAFPFTVTVMEDQGIHVTLDDFIPKLYVRRFLDTLVETEGYDWDSGEWPEYEALVEAIT